MSSKLPQRPDLDHLRRQAKSLLGALQTNDKDALATMRDHLPAAKGMTPSQIRKAGFRLADAQWAIARKTGFASWPQLARHVEQLRSLEGAWEFESLEVDGRPMAPAMLQGSRVLIDGDCFRSETPGAIYDGVFNIDVEATPQHIDIEFIAGPEAGNWNYGIFRLEGDQLHLCLNMSGKGRPKDFKTAPSSHCALEILRRASSARPQAVTGGGRDKPRKAAAPALADPAEFAYVESPTLTKLQGEWKAVKIVQSGQALPVAMCASGRRTTTRNELKVTVAGQLMLHALVRIDESTDPMRVDYCFINGPSKGTMQLGILQWVGEEICSCMSPPGSPRPTDFSCPPGSNHTLSQWRRAKE